MQAAAELAPSSSLGLGWQPTDRHGDFFFFLDDSKHSQADGQDELSQLDWLLFTETGHPSCHLLFVINH